MKITLSWHENHQTHTINWLSESDQPKPETLILASDELRADDFLRLARSGTAVLWRGDFHNAKQLLAAVQRRIDKKISAQLKKVLAYPERFILFRRLQGERAVLINRLLCEVEDDFSIRLPRAPNLTNELGQCFPQAQKFLLSIKELLGLVGAYQWRTRGVFVQALGERIHPHYSVFSPTRNEYLDLLASAPLPAQHESAIDVGTGTGVLAAILIKRGVRKIWATDHEPRALACAQDNFKRLGIQNQISVVSADLLPDAKADLIVFNPPWLPLKPSSRLEGSVYDEDHSALKRFLRLAPGHLTESGQIWLIISNFAEILGLRSRHALEEWFLAAELEVLSISCTSPRHQKAKNEEDPLFAARSQEITTLYRLARKINLGQLNRPMGSKP